MKQKAPKLGTIALSKPTRSSHETQAQKFSRAGYLSLSLRVTTGLGNNYHCFCYCSVQNAAIYCSSCSKELPVQGLAPQKHSKQDMMRKTSQCLSKSS